MLNILKSYYNIKAAQFSSEVSSDRIISDFNASMNKKCCGRHFKVVILNSRD